MKRLAKVLRVLMAAAAGVGAAAVAVAAGMVRLVPRLRSTARSMMLPTSGRKQRTKHPLQRSKQSQRLRLGHKSLAENVRARAGVRAVDAIAEVATAMRTVAASVALSVVTAAPSAVGIVQAMGRARKPSVSASLRVARVPRRVRTK